MVEGTVAIRWSSQNMFEKEWYVTRETKGITLAERNTMQEKQN